MKVLLQPSLRGLSGKMGDWVYRYSKKKETTTIGEKPVRTKELTEAQAAHQDRFGDALQYAGEAMDDPARREFYEMVADERNISPRNAAVADFFNVPSFKPLDLEDYRGRVGDPIIIRMKGEIGLVSMEVSIDEAGGTDIEKGRAVETSPRSGKWIYSAGRSVDPGASLLITITATDYAGKKVVLNETATVGGEA